MQGVQYDIPGLIIIVSQIDALHDGRVEIDILQSIHVKHAFPQTKVPMKRVQFCIDILDEGVINHFGNVAYVQ